MDYLENGGRLYEFTVLAEAHSDDFAVECFDMSEGGGLIGTIRIAPGGGGLLTLRSALPISVLRRWLEIARTEAGLVDTEEN